MYKQGVGLLNRISSCIKLVIFNVTYSIVISNAGEFRIEKTRVGLFANSNLRLVQPIHVQLYNRHHFS